MFKKIVSNFPKKLCESNNSKYLMILKNKGIKKKHSKGFPTFLQWSN